MSDCCSKICGSPSPRCNVASGVKDFGYRESVVDRAVPDHRINNRFEHAGKLGTSADHVLKVSMSVDAQIRHCEESDEWIQSVCETLAPTFPTCMTASSSSSSATVERLIKPSDEADSNRFWSPVGGK
jgi:hypothetical protein